MRARRKPSQSAAGGPARWRLDLRDIGLALAFNLALFGGAVAAARLAQTVIDLRVYDYLPAPAAMAATRRALEHAIAAAGPADQTKSARWNGLVAAQVQAGDLSAARGVVLAAPAALPGDDAANLRDVLPEGATDSAVIAAASGFLQDDVRNSFRLLAETAPSQTPQQGAVFALVSADDLARAAADFAAAAPDTDPTDLVLSAIGPVLPAAPEAVRGATIVRAALRTGQLAPALQSALRVAAEDATPQLALRGALGPALAAAPEERTNQTSAAFNRVLQERPYLELHRALFEIGVLNDYAGAATTALLLRHAQTVNDLSKLDLIARSGGDLAIAAAKILPPGKTLLATARGTLAWSERLVWDIVWVAIAALTGLAIIARAGLSLMAPRRRRRRAPAPATQPIIEPPTKPIV
jgi:hypothetical protein